MPDIKCIPNVGAARAKMFAQLDIESVSDLLHYYPRTYEDRRPDAPLSDFKRTEDVCIIGRVIDARLIEARAVQIFKAVLQTPQKQIYEAAWFKRRVRGYDAFAQIKKDFKPGAELWIIGRRDDKNSFLSNKITAEEYYPLNAEEAKIHTDGLIPIYGLTKGLTNKFFRAAVATALPYITEETEILPQNLLQKRHLLSVKQALHAIHFPSNIAELQAARRRMIYEEFLLMTLAWNIKQNYEKTEVKSHSYEIKRTLLTPFKNNLGYSFTKAQVKVINEIFADMQNKKPMTRLLQGDVGSGKTVVALSAILLAAENGYQTAFMAPTEILATQHYLTVNRYLKGLNVKTALLTSKITAAAKKKILQNLAEGKTDIIIGTHALIEDNVQFKNLKLIVIDEQHRFGVKQRAALRAKAANIDMLSMTATPIPRTFAMAFYGDLDVSTIDELPPGRKPVKTQHLSQGEALDILRQEVQKGRQAYVVYPLIDESDKLALKAATQEYENLKKLLPQLKLAMIHGQMKSAEKQKIMEDFLARKTDVLVATPVIEVGIDVKNATVMIIQNAERFGLASLHQLRGRVGRGSDESFCILVSQNGGSIARERINTICQTSDGFKIGEKDLELRGPGEILGTRQSGDFDFKTGDIIKDKEVLQWAAEDRAEIIKEDPRLKNPVNGALKQRITELYKKSWNLIDLG